VTHILDNPIWNALITNNKHLAYGNEQAKCLKREVGIFAGLRTNSESDLSNLQVLIPEKKMVVLFTPEELSVPAGWQLVLQKAIFQMVYEQVDSPRVDDQELVGLQEQDIPAMLDLTALTKPGPFLSRTIEFGHYQGIYKGNTLVAMAGQRLQPDPYTEISAVCTHPEHTGKGHAAKLVRSQISQITAAARIPFLHLDTDNTAACRLYERLGF
jgi:predicted GNAT family acetyltransferase